MSLKLLLERSSSQCELCTNSSDLQPYVVPPSLDIGLDNSILACGLCRSQINKPETINPIHWRGLLDAMWSEQAPVQVMAWRILNHLDSEPWAQDGLAMFYLDDEVMNWAKSSSLENPKGALEHKDSNGVRIESGDTVVLIKDLPVKGTSMIAKRGTSVRKISVSPNNSEHISGKVNGQTIVILTQFVKKQ